MNNIHLIIIVYDVIEGSSGFHLPPLIIVKQPSDSKRAGQSQEDDPMCPKCDSRFISGLILSSPYTPSRIWSRKKRIVPMYKSPNERLNVAHEVNSVGAEF